MSTLKGRRTRSSRRVTPLLASGLLLVAFALPGCQSVQSYFEDRVLDFVDIWGFKFVWGKGAKLGAELGYGHMSTEYDDFIMGGIRRHVAPPNMILGWYDFEKYGFQSRAAGIWREKGVDILGPVDKKLRVVAGNDYIYESVDEFNENWRRAPERANVVVDYRQPKYHYITDLHITMAFLFGIEFDFSAWQFVDFVLGWFHVDIVKDDQWNRFYNEEEDSQPAPERIQRREARPSVETSTKS